MMVHTCQLHYLFAMPAMLHYRDQSMYMSCELSALYCPLMCAHTGAHRHAKVAAHVQGHHS
jgi:hypothetical protein